jgi:4-oxalocrotonate tautomerase
MPYVDVVVSHEPDPRLAQALALGISERTKRLLGKSFDHTAVTVRFVPRDYWFIGGRSLAELGVSSFWLDVKVTNGTNHEAERAAYLDEITGLMRTLLGTLHEVSYLRVDAVAADAWGFGGLSQKARSRSHGIGRGQAEHSLVKQL